MRLNNIAGFKSIQEFVNWKIELFGKNEKTYNTLFNFMFSEEKNVFCEKTDGYKIYKKTYGESKLSILSKAKAIIRYVKPNTIVGLSMKNSVEWIEWFWSILMCGGNPLLINDRLPIDTINNILENNGVSLVLTDKTQFKTKTVDVNSLILPNEDIFEDYAVWGEFVYFMSSGTSGEVKLCGYTAENFYYQLCNSVDIVNKCPQISKHYDGQLKLLTLLPFYHVFGFIAVYLWFGFFSRTFVFLKDLNPRTIQLTIKKHKVTHFFAVPLVWESVYKASLRAIKTKGEATYSKFCKGLTLANQGKLGEIITRKSMGEVRNNLFGESIQFLISGGGAISNEALKFFNGIGYNLANGYGMTEVGITSVETSSVGKIRSQGSIGAPFIYTKYSINEDGELLIQGKNMAKEIIYCNSKVVNNGDSYFNSHDLAKMENDKFYSCGRTDDLIVSKTGEKINPYLLEKELRISSVGELCIAQINDGISLILGSAQCYSSKKFDEIMQQAKSEIERLRIENEIKNVLITTDSLLEKDDFKLNRKAIKQRIINKKIEFINSNFTEGEENNDNSLENKLEKEVCSCFCEILSLCQEKIALHSHFFNDLGGSSLDYFMLTDLIMSRFGVDIKNIKGKSLCTVHDICECIKEF